MRHVLFLNGLILLLPGCVLTPESPCAHPYP